MVAGTVTMPYGSSSGLPSFTSLLASFEPTPRWGACCSWPWGLGGSSDTLSQAAPSPMAEPAMNRLAIVFFSRILLFPLLLVVLDVVLGLGELAGEAGFLASSVVALGPGGSAALGALAGDSVLATGGSFVLPNEPTELLVNGGF